MSNSLKKQPSQKRSQERVQKILVSCSDLLRKEGLQSLTMPKLAKAANVSVGSLYQYFENKQAVLQALYEDYLFTLRQLISDFLPQLAEYQNWKDGMGQLLENLFEAEQASGTMSELNQAMQLYPELEALDERHQKEVSALLIQVLKHYDFPGSKSQLEQLMNFTYAINIGTWSYRTRFSSPKQLKQANHWEKVATTAVLEDYLLSFEG
ncbi:TetR/AcrR family transcriptional regulator [uncultured Pseudoteredinibacter sp.]|uniref:TetR/AcrR family transcriptional regulator n=1 Tax=uncultured Pseudoteredinibacter sp. TaxID=1641701 RepID=UPI002606D34E|nr:TetR/AcrR family transcriptional regulator [uncultured Pseudoteredinibacter sp.]